MAKRRCTIKDEELKKELNEFNNWLNKQINKTLQRKYRVKKPLKAGYKKEINKKLIIILQTHIGKLPSELTKKDIEKWEDYCYSNYENNGNVARFLSMNKLLEYLGKKDLKLKSPYIIEKTYDTLTEQERQHYIETANSLTDGTNSNNFETLKPNQMTKFLDKSIVLMSALLESRPSELPELETNLVDFNRQRITLKTSKTHDEIIFKGMKDEYQLMPLVIEALRDWLYIRKRISANRPENEKYLFIHPSGRYKGEKIGYSKILITCKEVGIKAGIKAVITTPYCLKRTEISRDCDRTNNPRIPQIRARHTNINSTMRYNKRKTRDVIEYINSDRYGDTTLTVKSRLQKLAEKAVTGEIPFETWQQLRTDLRISKVEKEKEHDLIGYG